MTLDLPKPAAQTITNNFANQDIEKSGNGVSKPKSLSSPSKSSSRSRSRSRSTSIQRENIDQNIQTSQSRSRSPSPSRSRSRSRSRDRNSGNLKLQPLQHSQSDSRLFLHPQRLKYIQEDNHRNGYHNRDRSRRRRSPSPKFITISKIKQDFQFVVDNKFMHDLSTFDTESPFKHKCLFHPKQVCMLCISMIDQLFWVLLLYSHYGLLQNEMKTNTKMNLESLLIKYTLKT